jgi:ubiquinone/menaquinone biosynthesis C-methylase UbiE
MKHSDCVKLLERGIPAQGGIWAEFGSGDGAFTLALAELLHPDGTIFSVDINERALNQQRKEMQEQFPDLEVHYLTADFTKPLDLPSLDGILMANALHYIKEKESFISKIRTYLKSNGRFLIVEYNIDHGNHWVPYPISLKSWQPLAIKSGFTEIRLLNMIPSRYHNEIYSAVSY